MLSNLVLCIVLATVISIVAWVIGMLIVRGSNFTKKGKRRFPARGEEGEVRSSEIKYHNEAIYHDFEFFFKVTLAILGGTAFVVTSTDVRPTNAVSLIIQTGGWLQFLAGLLFSVFVFLHQKSKIERWERRFAWWQPITWQECWMIISMLVISSAFCFIVVPELVALI
jgi:hypothetical protein